MPGMGQFFALAEAFPDYDANVGGIRYFRLDCRRQQSVCVDRADAAAGRGSYSHGVTV